jgi:hypothetical protein
MAMLRFIPLNYLRNQEFEAFFSEMLTLCQSADIPAELNEPLQQLSEALSSLHHSMGKFRQSLITKELVQIDRQRDACLRGIHTVVKGYTHHFDEAMVKSAQVLLKRIDSYGAPLVQQNYQAKTANVWHLTESFETRPEYRDALLLLGLSPWANQLKEINKLFDQRQWARLNERVAQSGDSATKLRKQVIAAYGNFRRHLEANSILNGKDKYRELINLLNTLIGQNHQFIQQRRSRRSKKNMQDALNADDISATPL